jgi:hypothetical protein
MTSKKLQLRVPADLYEQVKKYGDQNFCRDTEAARQLIVIGLKHSEPEMPSERQTKP